MNCLEQEHWLGFRELDIAEGMPKGSAFKAFKALRTQLSETEDFQWIPHGQQTERVERLRRSGRIYQSSVNVVLLSPETAARLRDWMSQA